MDTVLASWGLGSPKMAASGYVKVPTPQINILCLGSFLCIAPLELKLSESMVVWVFFVVVAFGCFVH